MSGLTVTENALGWTAVRLHYSCDPTKDPHTETGAAWLERARRMYPDPHKWATEMEINWWITAGARVYPEFIESDHCAALDYLRRKVLYRAWDFGWHCVLPEAEMLTAAGWRRVADVQIDDEVATLQESTGAIEYQGVLGRTDEQYDGPLYRWRHRSLDLAVTAGHRMLYQTRDGFSHSTRADQMPRTNVRTPYGKTRSEKSVGEAWAVMLGLWLAEGSVVRRWPRRGKPERPYQAAWIWQKHQDPWMDNWLSRTGLAWKYYSDKRGGRGWCVGSKPLAEYFAQFGHARDKYVPDEMKRAPADEIRLFLEAYRRGDGHESPPKGTRAGRTIITTYSRRMADDLQELYALIGVTATIGRHRGGWTVSPRTSGVSLSPKTQTVTHYTGRVVCVETPNKTILVRYPGSVPVWVGNSPACLIAQLDAQDRLLILREVIGHEQTTRDFAKQVIEQCAEWYPNHAAGFDDCCDPAGQQRHSAAEASEVRDVEILGALGIYPRWEHGWSRKDGRALIHQMLVLRHDHTPSIYVDQAGCPVLVQGFLGKFVYPTTRDGRAQDEPDENNHPWSDAQAALRYLATRLYSALGLRRFRYQPVMKPANLHYHGYGTPLRGARRD